MNYYSKGQYVSKNKSSHTGNDHQFAEFQSQFSFKAIFFLKFKEKNYHYNIFYH